MRTESKVKPAPPAIERIWLANYLLGEHRYRPCVITSAEEAEKYAGKEYWTVVGPYAPAPTAGQMREPTDG